MHEHQLSTAVLERKWFNLSKLIKSTPVLLGLSLVFFYYQQGMAGVYSKYFGVFDLKNIPSFAFFSVYTLLWLLVIPIATNKIVFKQTLKEIGLTFPANKILALLLSLLALFLLVPVMIFFSKQIQFQGYSLGSPSLFKFTFITVFLFPLYYLGEEFFFRGFLFLNLWKRVKWHSFWITDILFTLSHLGKPGLEILLCIPATVIFNCLTLCTKSIYPAVIVHSCLGILLSILVTFHLIIV